MQFVLYYSALDQNSYTNTCIIIMPIKKKKLIFAVVLRLDLTVVQFLINK